MDKQQKEVVESNKAQEFVEKYNELVKEYNMQLVAVPVYKQRDDGTFSLVIQMQVAQLPKVTNE